jgi:PAS domain-containing protein
VVFRVASQPFLMLDLDYRIRAVNGAYERATGRPQLTLVGEQVFDAVSDSPADPGADGITKLGDSLDQVFSHGQSHWMGVQRYDVQPSSEPHRFVTKVWVPSIARSSRMARRPGSCTM